jgi:hypothetical protein
MEAVTNGGGFLMRKVMNQYEGYVIIRKMGKPNRPVY